MAWVQLALEILKWLFLLWSEYNAGTDKNQKAVDEAKAKQIAVLDAIAAHDSGALSRMAEDRAARLRLALADIKPVSVQPRYSEPAD